MRRHRLESRASPKQLLWAIAIAALGVILFGCRSTGAYPFDYFSEMHYQDSYRSSEPPRFQPPARSVSVEGPQEPLATVAQASALQNPVPRTPQNLARASEIYRVNCLPCHGPQGTGNGIVSNYFRTANQPTPADYTTEAVRALSDGQLFERVTNGFGVTAVGTGMPPFQALLTPQERWLVVWHIRVLQGQ
jgi:mono/diheme cytochrome c family protein